MFYISEIKIDGIWGKRTIDTTFDRNINIFIGKNGTGKTTFLNIIIAVLSVDISQLTALRFSSVRITLKTTTGKTRTIIVNKEKTSVKYKISRQTWVVPIFSEEKEDGIYGYRMNRLLNEQRLQCTHILGVIQKCCSLTNISVHRELHRTLETNRARQDEQTILVDKKLMEMVLDLSRYYRSVDEKIKNIFSLFQQDMLSSMLYNEAYDSLRNMKLENVNVDELRKGVKEAYKNAGLINIEDKINTHIDKIKQSIDKKNSLGPEDRWEADQAFPLTLYMRSNYIVSKLKDAEKKKEITLQAYTLFTKLFLDFCGKEVFLDAYACKIKFGYHGFEIQINELSSGEKHLFILLVETLLNHEKLIVSITDEPELSLHIEWQQKLLKAVKSLNRQAQIIVATHSPEIAGSFLDKVIDMEDILK